LEWWRNWQVRILPTPQKRGPRVRAKIIHTMENKLAVLPQEVEQLAKSVSVEKRNEVQAVLNHVFNGVGKMREQLDTVQVADENDKVNMKLANTIRLGVKQVRLDAEKTFDVKRSEVQQAMLSFKTEDQLWLKAKQTMQILTKEIEENAKWKESTKERIEAERKELKTHERIVNVSKFNPEITRTEFENMSDSVFETFLAGIEKAYNDRIEAEKKAEAERIAAIEADRKERERIKSENERLQKEAEAKEKALAVERAKAEAERKAIQEKAEKELAKQKELARIEAEKAAAERAKLAEQIRLKEQVEAEAKQQAEAEQKAKDLAEKKAKAAPDKVKLQSLIQQIEKIQMPEVSSEEAKKVISDVHGLLKKVNGFINEKINSL
jgi:hypothetical protein